MSGGEEEAKAKGGNEMVGTGGFGFGRDTDSGLGGGSDGGVGGDRRDGDGDVDGRLVKWGGYCSNHNLRDRD